ncbi:MAG: hypothetical protein QOD72_2672 [Acidimicrobiaceae bacterium]|nr:hypothetical protein [Acidimicrobiaceae bacterium]
MRILEHQMSGILLVMGAPSDSDLEAIADALRRLGVAKRIRRRRASIAVDFGGGDPVDVLVAGMNTVRPGVSSRLESGRPLIVVADRVPAAMRAELDAADAGWLDRRGHLKFHHDGVWIDTDIPADPTTPHGQPTNPLAGPVARSIGFAALVAFPSPLPAIRELARRLEASPAGVSQAVGRLTEAGLLTRDRRAAVPALFWAVTDAWAPAWQTLNAVPRPAPGLVAVGTRAASALGAPVVASRGYPVELLADDTSVVRRLTRSGSGETGNRNAPARVALAPSKAVYLLDEHPAVVVKGHPAAPVAVVAASIAADPARGAETVEQWELADRAW